MTTYYVSNVATNGSYVIGNNSNDGLTPTTALLTLDYAINTKASANDTIIVNPGNGSNYSENSGSNYLNISKNITIKGDPAYVTSTKKPAILSPDAGTAQVVNLAAATVSFIDIIIDANSINNKIGIIMTASSSGTTTLTRVDYKNVIGTGGALRTPVTATLVTVVMDKCTMTAANGNGSTSYFLRIMSNATAGSTYTMTGCTVNGIARFFDTANQSNHTITVGASSDGTRNTITNTASPACALSAGTSYSAATFTFTATDFIVSSVSSGTWYCISDLGGGYIGNTITSLSITGCTFTCNNNTSAGSFIGVYLWNNISSLVIANNTFSGTNTGLMYGVYTKCVGINNALIHDNTFNCTGVGASGDAFFLNAIGTGLQIYNNTINWDGNAHCIDVGGDGAQVIVSNVAATTGDQNLGDVNGNKYIGQPYLWPAAASTFGGMNTFYSARLAIKKVGTPNGNVTLSLYSNNAGNPNVSVCVSTYTLPCSLLTTSYRSIDFWNDARFSQTASTTYHLVVNFTGTVDGSNYVQIQKNASATTLNTSSDGSSWSAGSGSLLHTVNSILLNCVNPQIYNNYVNDNRATSANHGIIINGCDGGKIYKNTVLGGCIGIIFKITDGSVTSALCYDNLINMGNATSDPCLFDKGSKQAQYYNNTCIASSGASFCLYLLPDVFSPFTGVTAFNGTPSRTPTVKNNIFSQPTNTSSVYVFGANTYLDTQVTGEVIDYNLVYQSGGVAFASVALGTNGTVTTYATLALYKAGTGLDTNSINANPLLTGALNPITAAGFIPATNSPAKAAGINSNGIAPNDYNGNPFPFVPDIGAYSVSYLYQQAQFANKLVFNSLTDDFDLVASTSAISTYFSSQPIPVPVVTNSTIPPGNKAYALSCDATSGTLTITLPTLGSQAGTIHYITKIDSSGNNVTLTGTVNGSANYSFNTQNTTVAVMDQNTTWQIV